MPFALKARDVMDTKVVYVDKGISMGEVMKRMVENGVWSVVVTDKGLPTGVVTDRDFIRRCLVKGCINPLATPAGDIMSSPLITCSPEEPAGNVWKIMVEKQIRRVYVVEEGEIIGRVTQTGLFQKMLEAFLALAQISA